MDCEPQYNRTQGRWELRSRLRCRDNNAVSGPLNLIRVMPA